MSEDAGTAPVVALLGASGYVGGALLAELVPRASKVLAVSRSGVRATERVSDQRLDLATPGTVGAAVGEAAVIVHAAAYGTEGSTWRDAEDPASDRVNVDLVRELVDVASRRPEPPLLLFLSSAQAAAGPVSRYAEQKIEAERLVLQAGQDRVLRPVILRLPTIYGVARATGQTGRGVVAAMTRRALGGDALTMWNDGSVRRDLLHVQDTARAVAASLDHDTEVVGQTWQLSAGRTESLRDVFTTVARAVAQTTGRPPVPVTSVAPPPHAAENDSRSDEIGDGRFTAATGWVPQVALDDGVREVAEILHERAASH